MRRTLLTVVVVVASAAAGADAQRARKPATHTVTIDATRFQPDTLTVRAGDVVVWINKDMIPHTATSQAGGFDSGTIAASASWKQAFKKKGDFAYVCLFHPTMKATLKVE
jgi:plastocyanin